MKPKNILLVEGESDRGFFEAMCKSWELIGLDIKVMTPRDAGRRKNTKQAALAALEQTYLQQLEDGQIERLALVIDADAVVDGGGFDNTLVQLTQKLSPKGYALQPHSGPGLVFYHNDGLNDIGAWVMPDNAAEGMLEDWILHNLHPQELDMMRHVRLSIDAIPGGIRFKSLHRRKAEVATWLAWQENPDHGLWQVAEADLLDESAPLLSGFKDWLGRVFP